MPTTIVPPTFSVSGPAFPPIGIPFFPGGISRDVLERVLPPAIVKLIEALVGQIESEVVDPLLYGTPPEQLGKTFEQVYRKFVPQYLSAAYVLVSQLDRNPQQLTTFAAQGFFAADRTLRERGPALIGPEATTAALMGLAIMTRITRRAIATPAAIVAKAPQDAASQWAFHALAHLLTLTTVVSFLSREEHLRGGGINASILAHWSRNYAQHVYHLSKRVGLVTPTGPTAPIPSENDEENQWLAEAGLNTYRDLLTSEDADGQ